MLSVEIVAYLFLFLSEILVIDRLGIFLAMITVPILSHYQLAVTMIKVDIFFQKGKTAFL